MRARLYIRRSDDDQSSYSPEAQERQNRLYCELHGHEIVGVYLDDDLSGTKENRSEFQRLVREARRDPGSLVVIHKIDRFARDAEVVLRTIKDFDRHRVTLVSVSEQIDFSTPIGRVMLTNLAAFAEYYSRNLSTEVKKGLREKAQQGGWIGPIPFGYMIIYVYDAKGARAKGSGRLAPSEDAPVVVLIFQLYATGNYSDIDIAEELNRRGFTVPHPLHPGQRQPFQKDTVGGILRNRAYIGFVQCDRVEYPGNHEPLVDVALWDQCQAIRARRATRAGGKVLILGLGGLLSELAYCGVCGARLHWNKGDKKQGYYICGRKRRFGAAACSAKMIMATRIEPMVLDVLRAFTIPPALRAGVLAEVQRRIAQPAVPAAIDSAKVHEQLRRLSLAYRSGDPDLDDSIYQRERERLTRLLAQTPLPTPRVLNVTKALELLGDIDALLEVATVEQQRTLLQQVLETVWLEKFAVTAIKPAANYALLVEAVASGCFWRPRLGSNQQPSAPEADALSN